MLKSHLHGYFMPVKVYNKLISVVDPFAYEKYWEKQIQEKLTQLADDRIMIQRKFPKINSNFDKMIVKLDRKKSKKKREEKDDFKQKVMEDDWFKSLFTDKNFEIDESLLN